MDRGSVPADRDVSKKKKKPRRKKLRYISPGSLAARASGFAINENRRGTLVRLTDSAIFEVFRARSVRDSFAGLRELYGFV